MSTERGIETSGRLRPTTHRTRIVAIALLTTVAAALGLLISNPISANGATPISVSARGDAGGEKVELIADGKVIDTFTLDKSVNTFSATVNERPTNVRVRFINDRRSNGVDLNAVVERITVDGVDHSPTDTSVLSTGTYTQGLGCARGSARSNRLHCNGYFEFRIGEAAEAEPASGLRRIEVRAKGQTGEERIELRVGNDVLADWKLATSTKSFVHDTSASVGGKNVEVHFVNDAKSSAGDRNAQIDFVAIDGNKIEAEDPSVYSTGTYGRSTGCDGGNKRSEFLHCSGYFRFSIPAEEAGSAAIEHEQAVAAAAIAPAPEPEKAVDVSPEQSTDPDQKPAPEEQVAPEQDAVGQKLAAPEDRAPVEEPVEAQPESIPVSVFAHGTTGTERIELRIDDKTVARYTLSQRPQKYTWESDRSIGDRSVAVHFVNDGRIEGKDRNVTIDRLVVGGTAFQTESSSVETKGAWSNGACRSVGNHRSEILACRGYAKFDLSQNGERDLAQDNVDQRDADAPQAQAAKPVRVEAFPKAGSKDNVGCSDNCKKVGFQNLDGKNGAVLENVIISNSGGPCLSINNASNITIRNVTLRDCGTNGNKRGKAIVTIINSSDITITGSKFADNASRSVTKYNLIHIENSSQVTIRNNEIRNVRSNTSGGRADNGNRAILATGNRTRNLVIEHNTFDNPGRNALQLTRARNLTGVRIINNRIEGKARWDSEFEDMINFYSASGTSASPIIVRGNYLRNGGPSASGTAIILGDGEGTASSAHITVEQNVIVDPGHVGINVAGGHHFIVRDNIIYGGSDVGRWTATGLTINHYRYTPECRDHKIYNNRVYFKNQHRQHNGTNHTWNPRTCRDNVKIYDNEIGDRSLSYDVWDLD